MEIKIIYIIFLAAGSLGQKDDLTHAHLEKLEEDLSSKNDQLDLDIDESAPLVINDGAAYIIDGVDEKYIRLFEKRIREYRNDRHHIDEGNPDIHGRILRPCQAYDTFCIRKFFAEHSRCKISGRAVPDTVFRAQLTVNYPHVNMSATQNNVEYTGLNNARVEEFYINKATDNLVITIFFPSVRTSSNDTTLKFYLRGREPITTRDFGVVNTLSFSITAVIPNLNDLRLDKAEITVYANLPILPFIVGPGLAATTDPEALLMLAAFLSNVPMDQTHAVVTEASFYAATYIQYNICDFGLKVL